MLPLQGFQQTSPDKFVRIEDKFLLPSVYENILIQTIAGHMQPSYASSGTDFTLIESLYLDSDNLDFYQDHFTKTSGRAKVRVRKYAPNGVWASGDAFVEAKFKDLEVCTKERLH